MTILITIIIISLTLLPILETNWKLKYQLCTQRKNLDSIVICYKGSYLYFLGNDFSVSLTLLQILRSAKHNYHQN